MALTRRGRTTVITAAVIAMGVVTFVVVQLASGGEARVGPISFGKPNPAGSSSPAPAPTCPLTGSPAPHGRVPDRPALAVKVENLPASRPQTGLATADIVYEEPVEGGITRFIVVYQCHDAPRIEPVRSGRLTDPDVLVQFGRPIFGYAGGVSQVIAKVRSAGLIDVNYIVAARAYHRDPARPVPHNLYTSTRELFTAGHSSAGPPGPVFTYSPTAPRGRKVSVVHLPFSGSSDVYWKWSRSGKAWLRFHGDVPHTLSDGSQVAAKNVVVQVVRLVLTGITDVNGVASPEVVALGTGKAFVFRNGRMVKGTWVRGSLGEVTQFLDRKGHVIPLDPGNTWVELLPNDIVVTTTR